MLKRSILFALAMLAVMRLSLAISQVQTPTIHATVDRNGPFRPVSPDSAGAVDPSITKGQLVRPLSFEANLGQADAQVRFLARGPGYRLFLTSTEAVFRLRIAESGLRNEKNTVSATNPGHPPFAIRNPQSMLLRMKLLGANPSPQVAGLEELPGKIHYAKGSAPKKWLTAVPTYAKVQYGGVYPGVDLVYYGNQGQLEYDFRLAPGADPDLITLGFEGADRLGVDERGELVLRTAAGELRQHRPVIYQEAGGVRRAIAGGYVLKGPHQVGFRVGRYDRTRPLVIDPLLLYSTYLGGRGDENGAGIAVDAQGNIYVAGTTSSTDFPTIPNAHQRVLRGRRDVFVTKFDAAGSLVYSTYLGDECDDYGTAIAVDAAGNAYVTGRANFLCSPLTPRPPGAFVAKLDPTGALRYFFIFGGRFADTSTGLAITVDAEGNPYVAGWTNVSDFPTTPGAFQRTYGGGLRDGFVAKVNAAGDGLVYSTYLGGRGDEGVNGIAVDEDGNAYVTGSTDSRDFPVENAFQPNPRGGPRPKPAS